MGGFIYFEPKPNHLAKKNVFFPRGASFSACAGGGARAGVGDCKGGEISLAARISDVNIYSWSTKKKDLLRISA